MAIKLTKDSYKLICLLYNSYLGKKKNGEAKGKARYFGDSKDIQEAFMPESDADDVADECWGLARVELLDCTRGDDLANNVTLSDKGISYMENRLKRGAKEFLGYISLFSKKF